MICYVFALEHWKLKNYCREEKYNKINEKVSAKI